MKKISLLLSGIFAASVMAGCTADLLQLPTMNTQMTPKVQASAQVTAQSFSGSNAFHKFIVQYTFNSHDTNRDGFLTFDEYKTYGNMFENKPTTTTSAVPVQVISSSSTTYGSEGYGSGYNYTPGYPSTVVSGSTTIYTPYPYNYEMPTDPQKLIRFEKMDKNKDGKLSFDEANSSKEFVMTKAEVRVEVKKQVAYVDINKDNSISKDEFTKFAGSYVNMSSFIAADKNKDNKLTFSEFEDLLYAVFQGMNDPSSQPTAYPVYPVTPPPTYYPQPIPTSSVSYYPQPTVTSGYGQVTPPSPPTYYPGNTQTGYGNTYPQTLPPTPVTKKK